MDGKVEKEGEGRAAKFIQSACMHGSGKSGKSQGGRGGVGTDLGLLQLAARSRRPSCGPH